MMKNAANPIVVLNPGQNLRTFRMIMSVLSVQLILKLYYDMGMLSSRVFHRCMIEIIPNLFHEMYFLVLEKSLAFITNALGGDCCSRREEQAGEELVRVLRLGREGVTLITI